MFTLQAAEIDDIRAQFKIITALRSDTNERLKRLEKVIAEERLAGDAVVVANGSYARKEASNLSDLDFYILCDDAPSEAENRGILKRLQPRLIEIAGRAPSGDGAFGDVHNKDKILDNIGGERDSNPAITRRMLFLLEGLGIVNNDGVQEIRNRLIGKYVKLNTSSHQIALFLLNDIIRYYRTICVDFEFKTVGGPDLKPWGTRNIKLIFSRKLLYFSGLLAVAETAQCSSARKIDILNHLFSLPVVGRVIACCGERSIPALKHYEHFLNEMSKESVRANLDKVAQGNPKDDEDFRNLKDCGHHFTWELLSLLRSRYEQSHPIHRSIVL